MIKKVWWPLALSISLITTACHWQTSTENLAPQETTATISGAYQALNFMGARQVYPHDKLPASAHYAAWEKLQHNNTSAQRGDEPAPWESMGPHNRGGRTLALTFNPQNSNTLYAGSASGGLWRSYTAGMGADAWERVNIDFPVLGVSCITFAPEDSTTMYIGTGEVYNYFAAGTGAAYRSTRGSYGIGILKSSDGGATWEKTLDWSYDQNRGVWAVKVDPNDANTVFAATTEGVFRSTNGGTTWEQVLNVIMANDLLINPDNPNEILVGCGNFDTAGAGIYRSTDGGTSWSQISTGLPTGFQGKIQLNYAPSSPNIVYASIGNGFGFYDGATWLCRSTNFGMTWEIRSQTDYSRWQGWFAHDVNISPVDPDYLVAIGIQVWVSPDGGTNLTLESEGGVGIANPPIEGPDGDAEYVHSDCHDVIFHPSNPNVVYVASDGGIHRSEDGGQTWRSANGRYQTAQFYNGFSTSTQTDEFCLGGLQDNGTISWNGDLTWTRVTGGDGSWTAINPDTDDLFFTSSQNLNMIRIEDGSFFGVDVTKENPVFIAPFVIAPSDGDVMYGGSSWLSKSTDTGLTWETVAMQDDLDGNPILSMDVSASNPNVLYFATAPLNDRGRVFVTTDGGASFIDITGSIPDRFPMDMTVDPTDEATAYITLSGFGTGHVYKTEDYGASWTDISAGLPDVPTNAIVVDPMFPNNLYVGNDLGIFVSLDQGDNWEMYQTGLIAPVMVFDLKISPVNRKLRAATHGNGAFQRDMINETVSVSAPLQVENIAIFPNPIQSNSMVQFSNLKSQRLQVQVIDGAGRIVETLANGEYEQGEYEFSLNAQPWAAGTYFVRVESEGKSKVEKVLVVK